MNEPGNNMAADKSLRSVFVGNIPYEATEEKLKDIFNQVGQVVTFKLVYDRETGKPMGYGFCEYKDQETALSAMRNLNGVEIAGRTLRVDNACTEKRRMEIQSLMTEPVNESPFGPAVESGRAPEAISKAVASLPPEQMFELMQQMKACIQNNPHEARTMLLQNPQLAYALLQAQVVMKIVDPETAVNMLHKSQAPVPPVGAGSFTGGRPGPGQFTPQYGPGPAAGHFLDQQQQQSGARHGDMHPDMRAQSQPRVDHGSHGRYPSEEPRGPPRDPRSRDPRGERGGVRPKYEPGQSSAPAPALPPHLAGADPEKAQLIMQVLQLTDEQIAVLPPEQRQNIMVLKEQIQGPMR